MKFCEGCRKIKNWPDSEFLEDDRCEVCAKNRLCYDVPSLILTPVSERTLEQMMIYNILQQGFRDKAEGLIITTLDGRVDNVRTRQLQQIFATRGTEIDWFATFRTRRRAQDGHLESERAKRDRR